MALSYIIADDIAFNRTGMPPNHGQRPNQDDKAE